MLIYGNQKIITFKKVGVAVTTRVQVLRVVPPCNKMITTIILNSFQHIYNTNLFQNITYYAHFFYKHDKKMVDTLEEIQGGGKVVENFR